MQLSMLEILSGIKCSWWSMTHFGDFTISRLYSRRPGASVGLTLPRRLCIQESWAITKMTARCALHMVSWKFSRNFSQVSMGSDKRKRGRIYGRPKVFKCPLLYLRNGKSYELQILYADSIHRIDRNKTPLKFRRKVAVGVLWDSRKFSGHP